MWSFLLNVNSWKRLILFTKSSVLDIYKDSEHASASWKENCKFCYILQYEITCRAIFCHFSITWNATRLQFSQILISGPEYIIFMGMNILKTLQQLATSTKCFSGKSTSLNHREPLIDNKSEQKAWKVLAKEYIFGKAADTQPETLPKKWTPLLIFFN